MTVPVPESDSFFRDRGRRVRISFAPAESPQTMASVKREFQLTPPVSRERGAQPARAPVTSRTTSCRSPVAVLMRSLTYSGRRSAIQRQRMNGRGRVRSVAYRRAACSTLYRRPASASGSDKRLRPIKTHGPGAMLPGHLDRIGLAPMAAPRAPDNRSLPSNSGSGRGRISDHVPGIARLLVCLATDCPSPQSALANQRTDNQKPRPKDPRPSK